MLLVYTHKITPRITYIFKHVFENVEADIKQEARGEDHEAINHCWDQHHRNLRLPANASIGHHIGNGSTDHDPAGEPDMEAVRPLRFLVFIEVCDQWVAGSFHRAIGEADEEGGDQKAQKPVGKNGEDQSQQMAQERQDHNQARAKLVV